MEGVRMSSMNKVSESDWRLFRSRLPIWQEAYMERLNREYIVLLSGSGPASEKFWELEKRVRKDKQSGGVVMCMSRANMGAEPIESAVRWCNFNGRPRRL